MAIPLPPYSDKFWTFLGTPELRGQSITELHSDVGLSYSTIEQLARNLGLKMPELAQLPRVSAPTLRGRRLRGLPPIAVAANLRSHDAVLDLIGQLERGVLS